MKRRFRYYVRRGYAKVLVNPEHYKEMRVDQWIVKHVKGDWHENRGSYIFEKSEEATLFALKWA